MYVCILIKLVLRWFLDTYHFSYQSKCVILQIQTYKEDYQQEHKERENAHNTKEEEIEKYVLKRKN